MSHLLSYPKRAKNSSPAQKVAEKYDMLATDEHRRHVEHLIDDLLRIERQQARSGERKGPELEGI